MTYREKWDEIEKAKALLNEVHAILFNIKEYEEMKRVSKQYDRLEKIVNESR